MRDTATLVQIAERMIETTYGEKVSVWQKGKALNKFGSATVGTTTATVQPFQGSEVHETFVTTNLIDAVISTSAADEMSITVEGHTIDGDGNLTFKVQTVALTGQTKAALGTPLARVTRAFSADSGTFGTDPSSLVPAGTVSFYDDTDGDNGSGVPTTASAVKMTLGPNETQTRKCSTSVSQFDYWILTRFSAAVTAAAANTDFITFQMEIRDIPNGGAWRPLGREIIVIPDQPEPPADELLPYRIVPKNHDVRVVAATDAGTAPVYAEIQGFLAQVRG